MIRRWNLLSGRRHALNCPAVPALVLSRQQHNLHRCTARSVSYDRVFFSNNRANDNGCKDKARIALPGSNHDPARRIGIKGPLIQALVVPVPLKTSPMTTYSVRKFHVVTNAAAISSTFKNPNKTKIRKGSKHDDGDSSTKDDVCSDDVQVEMDRLLAKAYNEARIISKMVEDRRKQSTAVLKNHGHGHGHHLKEDGDDHQSDKGGSYLPESVEELDRWKNIHSHMPPNRQHVFEELRDETNAVETLLAMTSHPYFSQALEQLQQRKQQSWQQQQQQQQDRSSSVNRCTISNQDGEETGSDITATFPNSISPSPLVDDVSVSLHCAFLSVVSWLCGTLSSLPPTKSCSNSSRIAHKREILRPDDASWLSHSMSLESLATKESILLAHVLDLAERTRELNLPLTIPQYQTIMTMIARHSSGMDGEISIILLNMSNATCQVFGSGALRSDFFVGALKELIQRNHFNDAMTLLHGMNSIHRINGVRLQDGIDLLNLLKKRVDDFMAGLVPLPMGFDETEAVELSMALQRPIMDELKAKQKELEAYDVENIQALMEEQEENDYDDNDEKDDDDLSSMFNGNDVSSNHLDGYVAGNNKRSDNSSLQLQANVTEEYDGIMDDLQKLNNMVESLKMVHDDELKEDANNLAISIIDNIKNSNKKVHQKVLTIDPMTNNNTDMVGKKKDAVDVSSPTETPIDGTTKYADLHRNAMHDFIYCRNETWEIPDIVPQLEECNGGRKVLFSNEYEPEVIKMLTLEDDLFNDKGIDFGEDDEDNDDE